MLFLVMFGLVSTTFVAQELKQLKQPTQQPSPSGHVRCYTTENEAFLREKYPNRSSIEDFESWLAPKIAQIKADRAAGRNVQAVNNIPVVIHIIHNGDAVGSGENISYNQAVSQITVMNNDYRRLTGTPGGANSTGLAVDCEINFCLAQTDPSGNLTSGVVRHNITPYTDAVANGSGGVDWETRADVETMKAATIWDPTQYLNMWTIRVGGNTIQNGGISDLLGYAQFPDNPMGLLGLNATGGSATTDGVVAAYDAFGSIAYNDGSFVLNSTYNLGRTMTHEVGHWLGLRHIWGDNTACPATNSSTDKDFCADTPAANGPNYTCNLSANTCTTTPGNDQVQNYMDYTPDACMDTFTQNQKDRMVAVMTNAPRRTTLATSTKCNAPAPYIQFGNPTGSINENTNCSFTDVNIPVSIVKAPSANAVVTFNVVGGGTATQNVDYQVMSPTVTFATGSTTAQNLVVRVFHDGISESTETFTINMTLNANGGDAILNSGASSITYSIIDNDVAPVATQNNTILTEDFEDVTGWTVIDGDGDTRNWGVVNGAAGVGTAPNTIVGRCAYSEKSLTYLGGTGSASPNNFIISPQVTIPTGATAINLSYIMAAYGAAAGDYTVYFSTNISSVANITSGAVLQAASNLANGTSVLASHNMLPYAGQTGYIVFRHTNVNTRTGLLLLDTLNLTATIDTPVQTVVNTATQYQATLPTNGIAYSRDASTGRVMADINGTTAHNYGCTSVNVSRDQTTAGAAAVNYGANTANNLKVMAKTFTITPATNNTAGNATIKFYFSEAEIAAWETATGNARTALRVIKDGVPSALTTVSGTFGPNTTLTGTVTNGIAGVYYFGTSATLGTQEFEFADLAISPNPNKGNFNITLNSENNQDIQVNVFDLRGRQIYNKKFANNGAFNQNISLDNAQSGIYLVSISDGTKKTVKRIIVE